MALEFEIDLIIIVKIGSVNLWKLNFTPIKPSVLIVFYYTHLKHMDERILILCLLILTVWLTVFLVFCAYWVKFYKCKK